MLLILAGISIATLTGDNGILTKANTAKEEHKIAQYREELNLIILEEITERKVSKKEEPMIESLEKKIRKKDWVNQEKVKQYNEQGITEEQAEKNKYLFVESKEGYEFIIEVDNENETAEIIEANRTPREEYTITYHPNGGTGETIEKKIKAGFSIRLDECSYSKEKFKFVGWCEKTEPDSEALPYLAGSIYSPKGDVTLFATWETTVAMITFDSNDGTGRTQSVEVAKGKDTKLPENEIEREGYEFVEWNTKADRSGTSYKEGDPINTTEDITLYVIWDKLPDAPEYWIVTQKTDTEWYNYTNLADNTTAKVNKPKLKGKMTPIKYVGSVQSGSKWANAITADGSMWVWIPRFAYKITKGYNTKTAGIIEVAFLDVDNHFLNGETGTLLTDPTQVTYTNKVQNEWLVHPVFTNNAEQGGGFGNIEGFWMGKFETTGNTSEASVKPGIAPLRNIIINEQYKLARNSKFGEKVDFNSHMAKKSEWGACCYLAHSKYGTNAQSIEKGALAYAGGSNYKGTIYKTNSKQSTTYNATGVYDLTGGSYENVAAYVDIDDENLITYGGTNQGDLYGTKGERSTSTRFKTVYKISGEYSYEIHESLSQYKGDAGFETSTFGDSGVWPWFGYVVGLPMSGKPFFSCGTSVGSPTPSHFSCDGAVGSVAQVYPNAFRVVLTF